VRVGGGTVAGSRTGESGGVFAESGGGREQVGAFLARQGTDGNQQAALQQFWEQLLLAGPVAYGIFGTKAPGNDKSLAEQIEQAVKNNTNLETSAPSPEQDREKPQS
jgi:hypothetical protein